MRGSRACPTLNSSERAKIGKIMTFASDSLGKSSGTQNAHILKGFIAWKPHIVMWCFKSSPCEGLAIEVWSLLTRAATNLNDMIVIHEVPCDTFIAVNVFA